MAKKKITTNNINQLSLDFELNDFFQINQDAKPPQINNTPVQATKPNNSNEKLNDFKFALPTVSNSSIKTRFLNFNHFLNKMKEELKEKDWTLRGLPDKQIIELVSNALNKLFSSSKNEYTADFILGNLTRNSEFANKPKLFFAHASNNSYLAYNIFKNMPNVLPPKNGFASVLSSSSFGDNRYRSLANSEISSFFQNPIFFFLFSLTPVSLLTNIFSKNHYEPINKNLIQTLANNDQEEEMTSSKVAWIEKLSNILYSDKKTFNFIKNAFENNYVISVPGSWSALFTKPSIFYDNQINILNKAFNSDENVLDKISRSSNTDFKIPAINYLNSDRSQLNAIESALNGSTIIQGPPGAGKTNTIENLLLNLTKNKKTILLATKTASALETIIQQAKKLQLPLVFSNSDNHVRTFKGEVGWVPQKKFYEQSFDNDLFTRNNRISEHVVSSSFLNAAASKASAISTIVLDRPSNYTSAYNNKYDVVIIDEASQLTAPEGKMLCNLASQVIVAGDVNQLKPKITSFDNAITPKEYKISFLEYLQNNNILPVQRLHIVYRVKNADILNYSNLFHYNNDLEMLTENSPKYLDESSPVSLTKVDGVFSNSVNELEIAMTLAKIIKIRGDNIDNDEETASIIISTINKEQRKEYKRIINSSLKISELLNKYEKIPEIARAKEIYDRIRNNHVNDPFSLYSIGIHDIDSVQGKEADFVFINTVYGADAKGVFRHNFGALSSETEKQSARLLNVNATRTIQKTFIITSLSPEMFDQKKLNSESKHFYDFINFFYNASKPKLKHSEASEINPHIKKLANDLKSILPPEYNFSFNENFSNQNMDLVIRKNDSNVVEMCFKLVYDAKEFKQLADFLKLCSLRKYSPIILNINQIDQDIKTITNHLKTSFSGIINEYQKFQKLQNK